MITETILSFLTMIVNPLVDLIPNLTSLVIPDSIFNYLLSIFSAIGVFIPVAELLPILIFSIAVSSWRFIYSIISRFAFMFV